MGRPITPRGMQVRALKVGGEPLLCQNMSERDTARRTIHALGGKYSTRKDKDGWRVWRTE